MISRPLRSTLFPYTTLFRSRVGQRVVALRLGPAGLSYRSRRRCRRRRRRAAAVLWAWERSYLVLLSSSNTNRCATQCGRFRWRAGWRRRQLWITRHAGDDAVQNLGGFHRLRKEMRRTHLRALKEVALEG